MDNDTYIDSLKAKLPEDPKEAIATLLKEAATAEKRRRDTQSSYTKTRQENLRLTSEKNYLAKQINTTLPKSEALDTLKYENPDKWREEVNRLEREAQAGIQEKMQTLGTEAQKNFELEERQRILRSFSEANPDLDITLPEVQDQIPPKYLKQLETGEVTFEAFLNNVKKFVEAPKSAAGKVPPVDGSPDLTKLPGSSIPPAAKQKDLVAEYNNLII